MRSISLAVDVSNYVMLELGHPIHGYDLPSLQGDIVVRRATEGEKLTTLDGAVRTLSVDDTVVCDDRGPIGLAGVMGGAETELSDTTTDLLIEAAHWKAPMIARTARTHKLSSEASKRYERGVDPALPARATQRVAELLVEHGGGAIDPGLTVVGEPAERAAVTISDDLPARISGVRIDGATAAAALAAGGGELEHADGRITLTPPSWRFDLTDPYDLVEDVLRVVGYDQVPSVLPPAPAGRGLTAAQVLRRRVGMVLAGAGLSRSRRSRSPARPTSTGSSCPPTTLAATRCSLENPLSAEQPGMTTTLLAGLLSTAELNLGRGHTDVQIVETGRVFLPRPDARRHRSTASTDGPPTPSSTPSRPRCRRSRTTSRT